MTRRSVLPQAALAALAAAAIAVGLHSLQHAEAGVAPTGPGSMQAIRFDMDTGGNTATSLGPVQGCARINENNTLDADEDITADTVSFDLTAEGIPDVLINPPDHNSRMIGFQAAFTYNETSLTVQAVDTSQKLGSAPGSAVFPASQQVPDTEIDGGFSVGALDTSDPATTSESGSGVLARLAIASDAGASSGQYPSPSTPTTACSTSIPRRRRGALRCSATESSR